MTSLDPSMVSLPKRTLPIGAFPLPFGYLLLPVSNVADNGGVEAIRVGLLNGLLPEQWPPALRGYELTLAEDYDGALAAFGGDDAVSRFNRFVIDPDSADVDRLRADLGDQLGALVELVLFVLGRTDVIPAPDGMSGELAALALAASAALELAADRADVAVGMLTEAVGHAGPVSRALAGVLHGAVALAYRQSGDLGSASEELIAGIALLTDTDLRIACAEQHLELAGMYHEKAGEHRDLLAKAIHHYHCALQTITEEQSPEVWASAHFNLATAYLTMPMIEASDHLRLGVAVASLRAALKVYTQETHPHQWSSAQLNLANALVYAPSTHQADNLVEAVELYEAVLVARNRTDDPLGYARVLANQGNALAHLGMFDHARGKLVESRFIFEEFHEYEAVTSVRGLLDELARSSTLAAAEI